VELRAVLLTAPPVCAPEKVAVGASISIFGHVGGPQALNIGLNPVSDRNHYSLPDHQWHR